MLTFYYAPQTCALATHIVLEQVGCDYQALRLDFKAGQQRSPDFLAVNPKGRVPAIVTERGIVEPAAHPAPDLLARLAR